MCHSPFFEPETYRHVATAYAAGRAQSMGLTLPKTWALRYEASSTTTIEWKYALKVDAIEPK